MRQGAEATAREGRVTWHRVLVVGVWLALALGTLVGVKGRFWRSLDPWLVELEAALAEQDWQRALEATRHALDIQPADGGLLATAGHAHLRLGAFDSAVVRFEQALELAPDRVDARLGLAEALLARADTVGALTSLATLDVTALDQPQLRSYAATLESAGNARAALEAYRRLPEDEHASDRIRLHRELGDLDSAVELLRRVASASPDSIEVRRELARTLAEAGKVEAAAAEYRAVLAHPEHTDDDAIEAAWLLNEEGRHRDALDVLREAEVRSAEGRALEVRTLVWLGDPASAGARLTAGLREHPDASQLEALRPEVDALREELAERARLAAARDTPPEDAEGALDFWLRRVAEDPSDAGARAEAVALLEQLRRFEEAHAVLMAGREPTDVRDPVTLLHLARLSRWSDRRAREVRWLRSYEERSGIPLPPSLTIDLATALLESGRPDEASYRLRPIATGSSPDSSTLALALRAAEESDDLELVVAYLESMDRRWGLSEAGSRRRADGYRGLGRLARAETAFEALHERLPGDRLVAIALGDIRRDLGDFTGAAEAYGSVVFTPGDSVALRQAAALAEDGRREEAVELYRRFVDARPDHAPARLVLARSLAEIGLEEEAIPHYLAFERSGGESVSLELARAYLATERFGAARDRAQEAVEEAPGWEGRMVLAQALRFAEGRGRVEPLLDTLEARPLDGVDGAIWRARIAWLRDRPVEVRQILEPVVERGGPGSHEALLMIAQAAFQQGDLGRARAAADSALASEAAGHRTLRLDAEIRTAMRPRARVEASGASDDADVDHLGVSVGVTSHADGGRLPVRVEATPHRVSQGDADIDVTDVEVGVDRAFVTPQLSVSGAAGLQAGGGVGTEVTARVESEYTFADASTLGLRVARDLLWSGAVDPGPIRLVRVREVQQGVLGLTGTDVRLRGSKAFGAGRSAYLEGGVTQYSDDNERGYAYAQLQFPLESAAERWLALQPNLYAEDFSEQEAGYVSPADYLSVGLRGQGIWGDDNRRLRLELNPHFFRFAEGEGVGIEADAEYVHPLGPSRLHLRALYFRQEDLYDMVRFTVGLSIPLGGS